MHLAILHYHLNRGGVTRVIQNHLGALSELPKEQQPESVHIIFGGRNQGWTGIPESITDHFPVTEHIIPGLAYDQQQILSTGRLQSPDGFLEELQSYLHSVGAKAEQTVLHIHNHSIGKNSALPLVAGRMADAGYGVLSQIHDFAEDFRPGNYRHLRSVWGPALSQVMYPHGERFHYAVLNGRDERILRTAGVPEHRLTRIPNPVGMPAPQVQRGEVRERLAADHRIGTDRILALYPVRGIRRKNLGEAALWSLLFDEQLTVGTTLQPLNPNEQGPYSHWVSFAEQHQLPMRFGLGNDDRYTFDEIIAASDLMISTSIAEGFGMAYLETWLLNRRIIGRALPEIMVDFRERGLELDALSDRLSVPIEMIDQNRWRNRLTSDVQAVRADFDLPPLSEATIHAECDSLIQNDTIDHATLGSDAQQTLMRNLRSSQHARKSLLDANPWMAESLHMNPKAADALIARNQERVLGAYSLPACGERLRACYDKVLNSQPYSKVSPIPHPERILDEFLRISRLNPVRMES